MSDVHLFQSEVTLMEGIIPPKYQHKVFDHLIQAALESVKKEGEVNHTFYTTEVFMMEYS